jgi:hypothetical protein
MERGDRNKRVSDRIISVLIVPQPRLLQEVYSDPDWHGLIVLCDRSGLATLGL